jgi:hypothetical protein
MNWSATHLSTGGSRQWDVRPSWSGFAYGNGKPGKGTESIIGPEALRAYPISPKTAETKKPDAKKIATHVKFYGSESVAETMAAHGVEELPLAAYATDAPEGRRMTEELRALIHELRGRGCVVDAISKTLNLKPERVRRVLRESVSGDLATSA